MNSISTEIARSMRGHDVHTQVYCRALLIYDISLAIKTPIITFSAPAFLNKNAVGFCLGDLLHYQIIELNK